MREEDVGGATDLCLPVRMTSRTVRQKPRGAAVSYRHRQHEKYKTGQVFSPPLRQIGASKWWKRRGRGRGKGGQSFFFEKAL